jgi:two-component system, NtrC family, sensor kinase
MSKFVNHSEKILKGGNHMYEKRKFLALAVLFFFTGISTASTDSLINVLESNKMNDPAKIATLQIEISKNLFLTDVSQSIDYGNKALEKAILSGNKNLELLAAKNLGTIYYRRSDFSEALVYFKTALTASLEANNKKEIAAGYNNLGLVFNRLGSYVLALENHLKQLTINKEVGDLKGIAISNRNIGNIYMNLDDYDKALEYYKVSWQISEKLTDTLAISTALLNIGVAYMELEHYEKAISYYDMALIQKKQIGDQANINLIYANLGVVYNSLKKYSEAESYFLKSLELSRKINNRLAMAVAMMNLGDVYLKTNQMDKSKDFLNHALELALEIDSKKTISQIYDFLSKFFEAKNDLNQALSFYKKATAVNDSLLNKEKSRQFYNLRIIYEVEQKEREILKQNVSIQKLKASQYYLFIAVFATILLAFFAYIRYRIKKKHNRELEIKVAEALQKEKEQQQIIVHQASLTSLGELASGIAHEIKQPLQNISLVTEGLQMELAEDTVDKDFLSKSLHDIEEGIKRIKYIITEITNFSRGQQQQIIEWFDINTRIENAFSLARTKFSNRSIDVIFELDRSLPQFQGNPYKFEQVIVNFFNNAKDAIEEKAKKFSDNFKKNMIVRTYLKSNFINVEVEDSGIGIPDEIKTKVFLPFFTTKVLGKGTGLGLSISHGIAKEMGGSIEVESKENEGTLMRLKLPLGIT